GGVGARACGPGWGVWGGGGGRVRGAERLGTSGRGAGGEGLSGAEFPERQRLGSLSWTGK
ncbi:hypothetical protein NW844_11920, partial [Synechococcus sp. H55.2]